MLKQLKKKIREFRKFKYQKKLMSKKDLVLRNEGIDYISNLTNCNSLKNHECQSCKFYYKNLTQNNFIIFYKKFSANISLKEKYDMSTFKKKSNKSACLTSYIYFSKKLFKSKHINNLQKLNAYLKINDLLILLFNKNKHKHLIKEIKSNFIVEKKLLDLYL